jgi:hypothetical protein
MNEKSKAIQEVAKTTGKAIDASVKFGAFLDKCLGKGFAHLGDAFSDWAQAFRYRNLLILIDKVESIHRDRQLQGKTIPLLPKHVIPILEHASLEDDDDVRQMWAGLIANSSDPEVKFSIRKLYIEILSSLDPLDVYILNSLTDESLDERFGLMTGEHLNAEQISLEIERDYEDVLISLSNLSRHGLIIDSWKNSLESLDYGYSGFRVNNPKSNFRLSHLGGILLDGCSVT